MPWQPILRVLSTFAMNISRQPSHLPVRIWEQEIRCLITGEDRGKNLWYFFNPPLSIYSSIIAAGTASHSLAWTNFRLGILKIGLPAGVHTVSHDLCISHLGDHVFCTYLGKTMCGEKKAWSLKIDNKIDKRRKSCYIHP